MAEGNALELDEPAPAPVRMHRIILCCADSVRSMVEEVGRNLEGLGFGIEVVCGAEARVALLGRTQGRNQPTIYVVCVQGTLKEQVLKPLRHALATHGGPNEHLFVAVLDLALPLAMVGQIRRFAEALERMPGKRRRDALGERRQWREHFGRRQMEGVRTRAYRPLHVVEREAAQRHEADRPPPVSGNMTVTGPRPIVTKRRPARIEPTKKYRAVTGALPIIPPAKPPKPPKSKLRRGKGRPARKAKRGRPRPPPPVASDAKTAARPATPSERTASSAPHHAAPAGPVPEFGASVAPAEPRRRVLPIVAGVGVVAALVWFTGLGADLWARFGQDPGRGTVASPVPHEATDAEAVAPEAALAGVRADEPAPPEAAGEDSDVVAADEVTDGDADDEPTIVDDGEAEDDEPTVEHGAPIVEDDEGLDGETEDEPQIVDSAEDLSAAAALADAIAQRRVRQVRNLYVSARQGDDTTTWSTALKRCRELEIDGIDRWRLAHRRELKLMHVVGMLGAGTYWSYTAVPEDDDFAFAIDTGQGQLAEFLKQEPTAAVVCVRQKRTN